MNQGIVDRLEKIFADDPLMKAEPVDAARMDAAEKILNVRFSTGYREFLARYGGALVGPYPIFGLARALPMDQKLWSVVSVTQHFRGQSWPGVDGWYVISIDHAGNPIGIEEGGKVFTYDHDAAEISEIAESFEGYLEGCLRRI
jgi:hypothetical protein